MVIAHDDGSIVVGMIDFKVEPTVRRSSLATPTSSSKRIRLSAFLTLVSLPYQSASRMLSWPPSSRRQGEGLG